MVVEEEERLVVVVAARVMEEVEAKVHVVAEVVVAVAVLMVSPRFDVVEFDLVGVSQMGSPQVEDVVVVAAVALTVPIPLIVAVGEVVAEALPREQRQIEYPLSLLLPVYDKNVVFQEGEHHRDLTVRHNTQTCVGHPA